MNQHEIRMKELIQYTRNNSTIEPYGCSIYNAEGQLLVAAVGNKYSPINHAETLAINMCAERFPRIQWDTLTLYTTGEPCCMCAAACCWTNLKEVIYATDIPFMINLWGIESPMRAIDVMRTYPKVPHLIGGICATESNQLFQERQQVFSQMWNKQRWQISASH